MSVTVRVPPAVIASAAVHRWRCSEELFRFGHRARNRTPMPQKPPATGSTHPGSSHPGRHRQHPMAAASAMRIRSLATGLPTAAPTMNNAYSPLAMRSTADNATELGLAWYWGHRHDRRGLEATPIVVDGVMFSSWFSWSVVWAHDAKTGELLWTYRSSGTQGVGQETPAATWSIAALPPGARPIYSGHSGRPPLVAVDAGHR